ncbi:MAG TPA: hypothetical protein EYP90_10135, partial [Chromatiaceae bacterium]|nr:hypothetical protein [Chromatiaceae bacterium]
MSEEWRIIVRAEVTASCQSIPSAPPLVAVRKFGKGRIAIATFDARYFINDGYHPAYGGYALEKGDGFKLLRQLYDWLGEPSMRMGWVYTERVQVPPVRKAPRRRPFKHLPDVPLADLRKRMEAMQWSEMRIFKGVIGIHSDISDGHASVEDFCKVARQLGYDFLVFTEASELMDERKWEALVRACQVASDENFIAIPGLEIRDKSGVRIVFNLERFPTEKELGKHWARLLFNLNWLTVIVAQPHRNALNPWQLKFYTGLALLTYDRNRLIDDARALYRELSASDYRLIPVAINRIYDLNDLRATQMQAVTFVHARSLRDLVAHRDWQHAGPLRTIYGCGTAHVSSGITLHEFGVVSPAGHVMFAGAYRVQSSHKELVRIALESQSKITEVKLYRGMQLYRRFKPNRRTFQTEVVAVSSRGDAPWMLEARDADGRFLHSNALRKPASFRFNYTMCVDKQNSIITLHGLGMVAGWIAGGDVGAIFPLLPPHEIVPAGEDASWCPISSWEVRPNFGLNLSEFERLCGAPVRFGGWEMMFFNKRRCLLSSDDCIVMEDEYRKPFVHATIRTTYFRPRERAVNMLIVEHDVKVLKGFVMPRGKRDVTIFRIQTNTAMNPYRQFAFVRNGRVVERGKFEGTVEAGDRILYETPLRFGDGAVLYPLPAGNVGIFSLCNAPLLVCVGMTTNRLHAFVSGSNKWRNFVEVSLHMDGGELHAGDRMRTQILFVLDNRDGATPDGLAKLLSAYGIGASPPIALEVLHGDLVNERLPFELRARDGYVRVRLRKTNMPLGLPVIIRG